MQARKLIRRVAQRLPNGVVRALKDSPIGPALLRGLPGPELSVIVPVYNVEEYLAACLDSLLRQTLTRLEIIVVDDGSTDGSAAVIADYRRRDRRIKVIRQANAGLGAARNVGIAAASAPFITFLDSDDTIPASAYQKMVDTLRRTGSDFVVGSVRRFSHGKTSRPAWVANAHSEERLAITIDQFPDAMQDVIACNRMFRRDFWNTTIGPFPEGIAYEDHVPMVTAYLRAARFDLLSTTTYNWRIREDQSSIGQQKHEVSNLRDRVAVKDLAWEVVSTEASPKVTAAWLGRVLDIDLSLFVEYAVTADEAYRGVLQQACRRFIDRADDAAWAQVRVERKLRVALAAEGRWVDAGRVIEFFRLGGGLPQTTVSDGVVVADLPLVAELGLAPELARLSDHQSALSACVARADWTENGQLRIEGWAFARGVDLTDHDEEITAALVELESGRRIELTVDRFNHSYITRWANHPNQRYDSAGFITTVDVDALLDFADQPAAPTNPDPADDDRGTGPTPSEARWQLRVRTSSRGIVREGAVTGVIRTGTGRTHTARPLRSAADTYRIVPVSDERAGFLIHLRPDLWRAVELTADGRRLTGRIRALQRARPPRELVLTRSGGRETRGRLVEEPDGQTFRFDLELAAELRPSSLWEVRIAESGRRQRRLSWPAETDVGTEIGGYGSGSSRWLRTPRGYVTLSTAPAVLRVLDVTTSGDLIEAEVSLSGADPALLDRAYLHASRLRIEPTSVTAIGDRYRLTFDPRATAWGSAAALPIPPGAYGLRLPVPSLIETSDVAEEIGEDGESTTRSPRTLTSTVPTTTVPTTMVPTTTVPTINGLYATDLLARMPYDLLTDSHRITVARRAGSPVLTLGVRAPLADAELGRVAQRRLGAASAARAALEMSDPRADQPRDQVFFQCYRGEFATDSQLAIHRELFRRDSPLDLVWGVSDRSVVLPEGARAVLIGSQDWYDAIATSRYLCNNIDFDRFFVRRPFQRFLQTFHGYPFKSMGISFWRAKNFAEDLIEVECRRRNDAWTSILVPSEFTAELYRNEYRYQGEILVTGYPRDDVLVDPDPGERDRVLARLGVDPRQRVVLYAPTWRDTNATGAWSARFYDALDVDQLAAELGPDYTLLLRGHNYNLRQGDLKHGTDEASATILDVTRYPEINDLTLAADVAVLDYSSLRFDWALTGKPMLFFVPDLDDYLATRSALFDFAPTAPGPMIKDQDTLLAELRDLDRVAATYASALARFNADYNGLHDGAATARVVDAFFAPEHRGGAALVSAPAPIHDHTVHDHTVS